MSPGGKNEIQKIYDAGNDDFRAELEVALEYLRMQDRIQWQRPRAAKLSKCVEFRDFFEIRLFVNSTQHRPIGFFGPGENEFTILLWAIEKGNALRPDGWCKQANQRRKHLINGVATAVTLNVEGDTDA